MNSIITHKKNAVYLWQMNPVLIFATLICNRFGETFLKPLELYAEA